MRLVTLESLNRLRYPDNPVRLETLRQWCRLGTLPCHKQGREWMVDLDAFDASLRPTGLASAVVAQLQAHGPQ